MLSQQLDVDAALLTANRGRSHRGIALALALGLLGAAGCGDAAGAEVGVTQASLERVGSCADAMRVVRRAALERMNARIDQLKARAQRSTAHDHTCPGEEVVAVTVGAGGAAPTKQASPPAMFLVDSPPTKSAHESSSTNNQVAGVDEADFIKNDDKYVYAAMNNALRIVEAWPAETAHEVAKVALPGAPRKLFVHQDRALVYVSVPRSDAHDNVAYAKRTECTYGYDCEFTGDGTSTQVLVFDISDRAAPKKLRSLELTGSLLAARRIGDAVHTVLATPEVEFPGLMYPNIQICGDPKQLPPLEDTLAALEQARTRNTTIIQNTELEGMLPEVSEAGRSYTRGNCDDVYAEALPTGNAFTTLMSLDMTGDAAPAVSTIISKAGAVYASADALYMAINESRPLANAAQPSSFWGAPEPREFSSVIHKFAIGTDVQASAYVASGRVKGNVLNQFSMDEFDQHLRVATSSGIVPDPNVHSTLSVLSERGGTLELDGRVDDIAPSEDIRSVRFDGQRGYVVTFKKTDPLFVFDLAEPSRPRIAGELKIPGFSTYMHMMDKDHLLTIGYDAEDQGQFALVHGVLLQIFDVSDMQNPKLAHKTTIGTRGSSSEALTNHLAFTLFKDKLAVPMTICETADTQSHAGTEMTFSGLMVFDINLDDGIQERGRIEHPAAGGGYDSKACNNGWTNASSVVQRSVFMDDYVYSIANDIMRVQDLDALGMDVSSVPLR